MYTYDMKMYKKWRKKNIYIEFLNWNNMVWLPDLYLGDSACRVPNLRLRFK